jgi:hypothetical protein
VFPKLIGREWYQTRGFKEVGLIYGTTDESYRKTTALINRIRHQQDATPVRTLCEATEREGQAILKCQEQTAAMILQQHSFTSDGQPVVQGDSQWQQPPAVTAGTEVQQAVAGCGLSPMEQEEVWRNPVVYEDACQTVNISIDDVGAKKQKEHRHAEVAEQHRDPAVVEQHPPAELKYVHTTVAHVQHAGTRYTLVGSNVPGVLRLLLAFLLHNCLLPFRLQFFVDGQRTLHAAILAAFSWLANVGIILDWYHLETKCQMQLSLAMKGREIRNQTLDQLCRLLWYGRVDTAIHTLNHLTPNSIKDPQAIQKLIGYFERNRSYIPCYAVRKHLGLCNSSNRGEKMNDLVVANRQKHQGMSWSNAGSLSLASLSALKSNHESVYWFQHHQLAFKLAA